VGPVLIGAEKVLGALKEVHSAPNLAKGAALARTLRLETMVEVRKLCDDLENKVPAELWTLATYKELLFMDTHALDQAETRRNSATVKASLPKIEMMSDLLASA